MASKSWESILTDATNNQDDDFVVKTMSGTEIGTLADIAKEPDYKNTSDSEGSVKSEPDDGSSNVLKCLICEKTFATLQDLREHRHYSDEKKKSKKKNSKPFVCMHCKEAYTTRYRLNKHLDEHKNFKFECKDCTVTFKFKRQLEDHQKAQSHGRYKKARFGRSTGQTTSLLMTCETDKKYHI